MAQFTKTKKTASEIKQERRRRLEFSILPVGMGATRAKSFCWPKPDHQYWLSMSYWSLEEASCLLNDGDPAYDECNTGVCIEPKLRDEISRTYQIVLRAFQSGELKRSGNGIDPRELLKWAKCRQLPIPEGLKKLIRAEGVPQSVSQTSPEEMPKKEETQRQLGDSIQSEENKTQLFREVGKRGGQKSKVNKPILEAARQYLQDTTQKLPGKSNERIAKKFCNKYKENTPMVITIDNAKWEVFFQGEIICSRPWGRHDRAKSDNKEKSIMYMTFWKSYIPQAKKLV